MTQCNQPKAPGASRGSERELVKDHIRRVELEIEAGKVSKEIGAEILKLWHNELRLTLQPNLDRWLKRLEKVNN